MALILQNFTSSMLQNCLLYAIFVTVYILHFTAVLGRSNKVQFDIPPEAKMTAAELIAYNGYPVEKYDAFTADGYVLQLHRIPYGKNKSSNRFNNRARTTIFIQHGLLSSSADWVANLPNESLAAEDSKVPPSITATQPLHSTFVPTGIAKSFMLADAGFDVWLGNSRGNTYSARHLKYRTDTVQFWKFSWDEMAKYDLDAMFNVVLNVTEQTAIYYIGYSQGALIMFAKLAQDPKFASKIRKYFALAPIATVGHMKGLLSFLATKLFRYRLAQLLFGFKSFMVNGKLLKAFSLLICGLYNVSPLCDNVLFQIAGPESQQFNQSRLLIYLGHTPAGTSTMNMFHWIQMANSGRMQAFNYESKWQNRKHYGQDTAPIYNISSIEVPTYLYWSETDWLANAVDVQASLLSVLPNTTVKENNKLNDFNHLDFVWGLRASTKIYQPIIDTINKAELTTGSI